MKNKNEGKENKIIPGDFNCATDKMERYDGNKVKRLYKCCSNYALILDNCLRIYEKAKRRFS